MGGIFERAFEDPVLGPKLAETGVVFRLQCHEPDSTVVLDLPNKRVHDGDSDVELTATMYMSTEMANRFWQGDVDLTLAMAEGTVKASGETAKLLELVPHTEHLYPVYKEILRRDGRSDLLVD